MMYFDKGAHFNANNKVKHISLYSTNQAKRRSGSDCCYSICILKTSNKVCHIFLDRNFKLVKTNGLFR